jgi:hypothetical protein
LTFYFSKLFIDFTIDLIFYIENNYEFGGLASDSLSDVNKHHFKNLKIKIHEKIWTFWFQESFNSNTYNVSAVGLKVHKTKLTGQSVITGSTGSIRRIQTGAGCSQRRRVDRHLLASRAQVSIRADEASAQIGGHRVKVKACFFVCL